MELQAAAHNKEKMMDYKQHCQKELEYAKVALAGIKSGDVMKHNNEDMSTFWIKCYEARIVEYSDILARLESK
jgi:exonuclease VII small subunit